MKAAARAWRQRLTGSLRLRLVAMFLLLGAGDDGRVPVRHATRAVQRLERGAAPAGQRLRRSARHRHRLAAGCGAGASAGAAAAAVGAHRGAACAVRFAPAPLVARASRSRRRPRRTRRQRPVHAHQRRRPPPALRSRRCRLGVAPARDRLVHARRAAAADRAGLCLRAPPVQAARRHPQRRPAFRCRPLRHADPAAPPRRAGRTGDTGQHHGRQHPRHARCQACLAARRQP